MKRTNEVPKSKSALLFGIMFRYWPYMLAGLVAMVLYALFSGFSITILVPLFDFVFNPNKPEILYQHSGEILSGLKGILQSFQLEYGSIWQMRSLGQLTPLWESAQELMLHSDSLALLYILCAFILLLIILKNLSYFLNRYFFMVLRGRSIRDLRSMMFDRYLNQSLDYFGHTQVGDAIVRMVNDVEIVSNQYMNAFFNGIRDFVSVLVYMYIALILNARLFAYSILVVPVLTFSLGLLGKKIKKYSRRIQSQISALFSVVEETLNSIKIVKAFRKEDAEMADFEKINARHLKQWQRAQVYSAWSVPLSELSSALTGVLVVILGGSMIISPDSGFSLGDFTAFLFAVFSMLHPLKSITQLYTEVKKAGVSLQRIFAVLSESSKIQEAPNALEKQDFNEVIRFENVGFYYREGKTVLEDINLEIQKGQKIAFVGASGGGKTTITNLLNRMYDVKSGRILIDGIDIRSIRLDDLRRLFGVVTQESILFTKSVRENIAYGSNLPLELSQIQQAAKIAHADEFIQKLPDKYEQILDTKGTNLSGGQRQRLCIARAIVGDPPILIFDEATSALDTESERMVQDAIDDATKNRTVILIAHRLSTILQADTIVVLEAGKIAGLGNHHELLASNARYQRLYDLQFNASH